MSEAPPIMMPKQCHRHNVEAIGALGIPETGPWRAGLVVTGLLMFQWATTEKSVWDRADGKSENLSLVLAELGCLACAFPDGWKALIKVLIRGLTHAAHVSQGKLKNPDWIDFTAVRGETP